MIYVSAISPTKQQTVLKRYHSISMCLLRVTVKMISWKRSDTLSDKTAQNKLRKNKLLIWLKSPPGRLIWHECGDAPFHCAVLFALIRQTTRKSHQKVPYHTVYANVCSMQNYILIAHCHFGNKCSEQIMLKFCYLAIITKGVFGGKGAAWK